MPPQKESIFSFPETTTTPPLIDKLRDLKFLRLGVEKLFREKKINQSDHDRLVELAGQAIYSTLLDVRALNDEQLALGAKRQLKDLDKRLKRGIKKRVWFDF